MAVRHILAAVEQFLPAAAAFAVVVAEVHRPGRRPDLRGDRWVERLSTDDTDREVCLFAAAAEPPRPVDVGAFRARLAALPAAAAVLVDSVRPDRVGDAVGGGPRFVRLDRPVRGIGLDPATRRLVLEVEPFPDGLIDAALAIEA